MLTAFSRSKLQNFHEIAKNTSSDSEVGEEMVGEGAKKIPDSRRGLLN